MGRSVRSHISLRPGESACCTFRPMTDEWFLQLKKSISGGKAFNGFLEYPISYLPYVVDLSKLVLLS